MSKSKSKKAAPEAEAPALDVAKVREVLDILADGAPAYATWQRLEAEHGAVIGNDGQLVIHGIEGKADAPLDDALRLWGNKARRALLAGEAA